MEESEGLGHNLVIPQPLVPLPLSAAPRGGHRAGGERGEQRGSLERKRRRNGKGREGSVPGQE